MLITKLVEAMKYNHYVYLFDKRFNRSSEEELGQKLGYILEKSNFHRREANERLS